MTVVERVSGLTRPAGPRPPDSVRRTPWIVAAAACAAWVPFIGAPASPDEGGYLAVAAQWSPGPSLYGAYWVDRPPLLIMIHEVAVVAGGAVALRMIGVLGVVASIFLAARLTRVATADVTAKAGTLALVAPVVIAGIFLSTPLFGTTEVDGELLSVPFVLAGIVALVHACRSAPGRTAQLCALGAGVAGTSAAMVKQNAVDVFVVAFVLGVAQLRRRSRRHLANLVGAFVLGCLADLVTVVGYAAARGTSPTGLWEAVVTFRFDAASVINSSASGATSDRLVQLLEAVAASMAPLVVAALVLRAFRSAAGDDLAAPAAPDLRWAALALVTWEVVSIAAGGSYWLHYLLVLVPGIVLLAVAAAQRPPSWSRSTAAVLALAIASACVATIVAVRTPPTYSTDTAVSAYVRQHSSPGQGVVVAFGHPNIVWGTERPSPYPQLWSLPVRVLDSQLSAFDSVLRSPKAPEWVVINGTSLYTWGVDASEADGILRARYHEVTQIGDYHLWRRN